MSEQPSPEPTRRGRRAAPLAPDARVSDAYIEHVRSLTGGSVVSVSGLAPENSVFQQATVPVHDESPSEAHPSIPAPGSFTGFAVFKSPTSLPEPATASTSPQGQTITAASYDAPVREKAPASDRDLGLKVATDFYEDPAAKVDHTVRFRQGQTLSLKHRSAFRVNDHGVPVFSPGWSASRVSKLFLRKSILALLLASLLAAVSVLLIVRGIGSNSDYQALVNEGTFVEATVISVTRDSSRNEDTSNPATHGMTTTIEHASVDFKLGDKQYQREISKMNPSGGAITGEDSIWQPGDKVQLFVDPSDTERVAAFDPAEMPPVNWITLSPAPLVLLFLFRSFLAIRNSVKMRAISRAA